MMKYGNPFHRPVGPVLALAALSFLPAVAMAAGDHHGFDLKVHGLYIFDFLVVFIPIVVLVAPRLKKYLSSRYEVIKADIDEATQGFKEAETGMDAAKKRLENLSAEIDGLMEEFKMIGEKERDALAHDGAVFSEKIRKDTDFQISQAVKMARVEIRDALVSKSLEIVGEHIERDAKASVPDFLVERFVSDLRKEGTGV